LLPRIFTYYLFTLHSSLFTGNAPENFEVRGNSEEVRSESYIGSDSSQVSPPKNPRTIGASPKGQFSKNTVYLERGIPYFAFVGTNAVLRKAELRTTTRLSFFDQAIKVTQVEPSPVGFRGGELMSGGHQEPRKDRPAGRQGGPR